VTIIMLIAVIMSFSVHSSHMNLVIFRLHFLIYIEFTLDFLMYFIPFPMLIFHFAYVFPFVYVVRFFSHTLDPFACVFIFLY
jgi:hypothetical protein